MVNYAEKTLYSTWHGFCNITLVKISKVNKNRKAKKGADFDGNRMEGDGEKG